LNTSATIAPVVNTLATQQPLEGKTYSLRLQEPNSDLYYQEIAELADTLLNQTPDARALLVHLQKLTKGRRALRKFAREGPVSPEGRLVNLLSKQLAAYTPGTQAHLRRLGPFDRWGTLATSEEQYYLYMLEIEIINRLNAHQFRAASAKVAFLPHCLRDLDADCRAAQRDLDYVCKGCTDSCNVNHASKLLRLHGVKPYIWMTADLRALFRKAQSEGKSLGVLGIACIPELIRGMRMCLKHDVPVVGVPLDANRCARWWGEFYWNAVNLKKLESLL
jgi:hypothetical protein